LTKISNYTNFPATLFDVNEVINKTFGNAGHFGGDFAIMDSLVNYLLDNKKSISITSLNDSINSHLCAYAADESRKTSKIIDLTEYGAK